MEKIFEPYKVAEQIVSYCLLHDKKYVFISGNGGSGKTELAKLIALEVQKHGVCNHIDMDDFVVDTQLRKSSRIVWKSPSGEECVGKYTTAFAASYFLQNIKAILCNLARGNNYWHWPKKGKVMDDSIVEYRADAALTVIEGIGTVFLDKDPATSLGIFLQCSKEVEINRRINRARFSNEQDPLQVIQGYDERNNQFLFNILPHKGEYNLVLESMPDFSFFAIRDDFGILMPQQNEKKCDCL